LISLVKSQKIVPFLKASKVLYKNAEQNSRESEWREFLEKEAFFCKMLKINFFVKKA